MITLYSRTKWPAFQQSYKILAFVLGAFVHWIYYVWCFFFHLSSDGFIIYWYGIVPHLSRQRSAGRVTATVRGCSCYLLTNPAIQARCSHLRNSDKGLEEKLAGVPSRCSVLAEKTKSKNLLVKFLRLLDAFSRFSAFKKANNINAYALAKPSTHRVDFVK